MGNRLRKLQKLQIRWHLNNAEFPNIGVFYADISWLCIAVRLSQLYIETCEVIPNLDFLNSLTANPIGGTVVFGGI